ncbi:hypothetical protein [Rhodobacter capsulatus]|jgi:hypothetical protein|uniref:Uncharacterized protein n=1 Tax=Rhodobacter capsulatus (strain ATCC BAA-309 / NBRC 16581 / SB1003) TaxID=272942 RepID=D5ATG5_RHOCB|nr:hypothetical protein [Rhodobacter capsulatus]ADE85254.1 conserved hypothetical protein [Rhodobacter capsulatus SB 1003]ETD02047.1 hypothetical protein U714_08770 [Rhodobacter capsulatus DE442]ETD77209.1 hypothetical protein U717_08940 [Rhodobacter capsulatus R121]ETD83205.1 hypothetical protein U703_09585 [Rhodobacter capsulatus YW1]ETD84916.1 hypothetical protein U716_06250 [Rhodobacter capsulatus B6]
MSPIATASQHAWIYAVLIEMNDYCRNEGLGEVSAALTRAIERMEPVVFPQPAPAPLRPRRVSPFTSRAERDRTAEVLPFPIRR